MADLTEGARKALVLFEEISGYHDTFVQGFNRNLNAYRGILDQRSKAAEWQSQLHPRYVRNHVETTLAGLVDDRVTFRVKPRPKLYDPGEYEQAVRGAKAHEILHRYQLNQDRFNEKQRPFALQCLIGGFTVAKTSWKREERTTKRLEAVDVGAELGFPGIIHDLVEKEVTVPCFLGPTTEVVNTLDFFWHESAVDINRSPIVAHRVWMHFNELKQLEAQGVYQHVDELKDSRGFEPDNQTTDPLGRRRTKDMIEVLEVWRAEPDGIRVVVFGNRKVELRADRKNPFWHGNYPFVVAALQPELFQITSLSQVENISHLQEATWDWLNQTADNVRLLNNFIIGVNTTLVEDPDGLIHAPGERWAVEGPVNEAVQAFTPPVITAELALPHIRMLQADMQNLAGSQPFTSTSEAGRIGADTATEAALVTNLAQLATKHMKQQLLYAYERIGQQRVELNQQFLREPIMVEQIGLDNQSEWTEIAPQLLQGEYDFDITPMAESLMRAERKAEANAFLQTALQIIPLAAGLAGAGGATMLNLDEFVKQWLESYDIVDTQRFFSAKPAPPAQIPSGQQGAPEPALPSGVTAQQSIDPLTSPSARASLSPATMLQQFGAMRGAGRNA